MAPAYRVAPHNTLLLCLYASEIAASYAEPMLRSPEPPTGFVIDERFAMHYVAALKTNPAIHDGAIMGRRIAERYVVSGWSHRLFPPPITTAQVENRGSAFNSCLAMSALNGLDGLLLFSGGELLAFRDGRVLKEACSSSVL